MVKIHIVDGVEMVTAEDYRKVVTEFLGEAKKTSEMLSQFVLKYDSAPVVVKPDIPQADEPKFHPYEVLVFRNENGDLVINHSPEWLNKAAENNMFGKSSDGSCFLVMTYNGLRKAKEGDAINCVSEIAGLYVWKGSGDVRNVRE